MKALVKSFVPRPARRWVRDVFGWRWLRGDYQLWADALKPHLTEILGTPSAVDRAPPPSGDPSARPSANPDVKPVTN